MFSIRNSLFVASILCLQVSAMSEKQAIARDQVRQFLAGGGSLANETAYNTTNPFFSGTTDIPAENFTMPLDHFGKNTGKLQCPQ